MRIPMVAVAGVTAATALVGVSVVGCGANKSSTPSSSGSQAATASSSAAASSSIAPAADYTALLIKASDISVPGDTFNGQAPTQNPNGQPGVSQLFVNQSGSREVGDDILILPDADAAVSELDQEMAAMGNAVTGGTPAPAAVGTRGTMISGKSADGSKAVTVLLFTQGRAFANLEFDSPANDAVPTTVVTDVGQKQDTAIKSGLHS